MYLGGFANSKTDSYLNIFKGGNLLLWLDLKENTHELCKTVRIMAQVTIKNLRKTFGETVAVKELDLNVKDQSFVVLLGPSGCGKSTTLRCIAGLETPDEGEIYIGDRIVNDVEPKDRDIAMVFQSYALYPHMKVFDNLAFPLKMRGAPKEEIAKKVRETAELLQITKLLDRKPKQISGGEAQRTALGRAIVRDPQVFLMDEPLSNLDAKLRVHMRAELKRLQKELGVTTIYVTHDQVEAMTMADKVAILNLGELQQLGSSMDIFDHPANLFVAGFIGSPPMNLIGCTCNFDLSEKNGDTTLDTGDFALSVPEDMSDMIRKGSSGSELVLGVRPENVIVTHEKIPNSVVDAEVYVTEPLGSEIIVNFQLCDQLVKARVAPDFHVETGDKVWMNINPKRIHVFDKKTGKAIF